MKPNKLRAILLGVLCGTLYAGCSGEEERAFLESSDMPPDEPDEGDGDPDDTPEPDASPDVPDASNDLVQDAGDAGDASTTIVYNNCGEAVCAGTKRCKETATGAICECDEGFVSVDLGEGTFKCVTDTSCLKMVDLSCRTALEGAVYQAFLMQYCSGEPYLEELDPAESFSLFQDGDPTDPSESYWFFGRNKIEQVVTVALDVSGSVINDAVRFEPLMQSIRNFAQALIPGPEDPPVFFNMDLFGKTRTEYIYGSRPVANVDGHLERLQTGAAATNVDPGGTALYNAVDWAFFNMDEYVRERVREAEGALVYGTIVVITDGENTSGPQTLINVRDRPHSGMSMGINVNISDSVLTSIGKDGSFLAPDEQSWNDTLAEMARRIKARRNSIYQATYCSPATEGTHKLAVGLTDTTLTASKAECTFKTSDFGGATTSQQCKTFIDNECGGPVMESDSGPECGGGFQPCPYSCINGDVCVAKSCGAPYSDCCYFPPPE